MLWIVRVALVLTAAVLLIYAIGARQGHDAKSLRTVSGTTGQRQAIEFDIEPDGDAYGFTTSLYHHCSNGSEWDMSWSPSDGLPVPFERRAGRLLVREPAESEYDDGSTGAGVARMVARTTRNGVVGRMRSVWRFERDGEEYMVCDTGFVPFVAGPGAHRRVRRVPPAAEPWSVYPRYAEPVPLIPRAQRLFAMRVDRTCERTWRERPRTSVYGAYVRWHAAQLQALRRLGRPPDGWTSHALWLANFERRVRLERRQLAASRDGNLEVAAELAVKVATLKAEGNAAGLGFGLRTCTSNGPTGAPKSAPIDRRLPAPSAAA